MKQCRSCQTDLLDIAHFCHNCGLEVSGNAITCLQCSTSNPAHAKFCFNCGQPINLKYTPQPHISPRYKLNFEDIGTLPTQIKEAFLLMVAQWLDMELLAHQEKVFLDAFEENGFRQEVFEEASIKLAGQLEQLFQEEGSTNFIKIEALLDRAFQDLGEQFWVGYMNYALSHPLSPAILQHQGQFPPYSGIRDWIRDYLQLEEEDFKYYTHAVEIPIKKLNNARKSYFKHEENEAPLLFIDQTFFGNGKEGLCLTGKAIYWKAAFHKAIQLPYAAIQQLQLHKKHLEINRHYFNISERFNYKLLKLLNRLKLWQSK